MEKGPSRPSSQHRIRREEGMTCDSFAIDWTQWAGRHDCIGYTRLQ